jgi:hypothetical protein
VIELVWSLKSTIPAGPSMEKKLYVPGPINTTSIPFSPTRQPKALQVIKYATNVREWITFRSLYGPDTHEKKVHTNPSGITAPDISLFKNVNPPVRSMQLSETTVTFTHPTGGEAKPVQTVIVGEASCMWHSKSSWVWIIQYTSYKRTMFLPSNEVGPASETTVAHAKMATALRM